ncbi:MAG: sodium-dependent transporter [bacterium]|nr:sodium-dependent transporter [Hoylesella loescheii]MCI6476645.1 sodium-dependent transporter [Bacteroidales bacterium]MDO4208511.1 sodium-dependent transporter [bacterium]MDY3675260.1 sodium-dependent transporter [Prevotella sp.]MCI7037929.1 sodium-dependent transporter [Bacteroidales bacterium]
MSERANFKNTLGVILATAGSAVGLGNVWRFPYMTGQNGGASYIVIYILCVLLLGIPCMISEFIIGRHSASNTARAYNKMGNRWWGIIGMLSVSTGFLITCYYVIVSGWCLQYMYATVLGELHGDAAYFISYFSDFSSNPWKPLLWVAVFMGITHWVIIHGVRGGIERASKVLMPALFILLLVIVVASCMLPGAERGISFLLKPDFSKIDGSVCLNAMGQSFYSLSIGMGCICTYASYFSRRTNLSQSAIQISVIDCLVAILAGLMIFPAAFSVGVQPDSGPSLIYITLPNVFQQAFSAVPFVGTIVSFAFYALMSLAALTSMISLHEVSTAFFQEEMHISRKRSATIVSVSTSVIAIFCSLSLAGVDWLVIGGKSLFDWFDFVTGQLFLPIVGFFACLFIGWYVPKDIVRDEFTNWGTLRSPLYPVFLVCVRFVCPTGILLVFLNQLGII